MIDHLVHHDLDNLGFSLVLATLHHEGESKVLALQSKHGVLNHFLDDVPEGAGGKKMAFASRPSVSRSSTARHFPQLGVALGFVDKSGVQKLHKDDRVHTVHRAEDVSLIRSVETKEIHSTSELTWGLKRIGVEALWNQGLDGSGVRVGHLDTGVDGNHPALRGRIAGFREFDENGDQVDGAQAHDSADHGTHTAGTICGGKTTGTSIGVAPGAELYSGLVIEGGQVLLRVLGGMEWCLGQRVRVLNMSLGVRGFNPFLMAITDRLRERGVLPVVAIGNEGAGKSRSPGNYPSSLAVGASSMTNSVSFFSGSIKLSEDQFPGVTDLARPNLVAPGQSVVSAKNGGGSLIMNGTSQATPHVSGVAAILFQAKPDATPADVENAILETSKPLPDVPPTRQGVGLIQPLEALKKLLDG